MADLRYTVDVDSRAGINSLRRLNTQVTGTQQAFNRLGSAISGIAVVALIRNLGNFANSITDLSAATTISTQGILGFSQAVQQNGGSMQVGQAAITRFTQTLGRAATGTRGSIQAFARLGISLRDIQTQSPEQLLQQTARALGEVEDAAERSSIQTEIFGRAAARIDFVGVSQNVDRLTAAQRENAAAVESAGKANQNFADAMTNVRLAVLRVLKPLSDLAVAITDNEEALKKFIEFLLTFATIVVIAKSINALAKTIAAVGTSAGTATTALGGATVATKSNNIAMGAAAVAVGILSPKLLAAAAAYIAVSEGANALANAGPVQRFFETQAAAASELAAALGDDAAILGLGGIRERDIAQANAAAQMHSEIIDRISAQSEKLLVVKKQLTAEEQKAADQARATAEAAEALSIRQQVEFARDLRISAEQTQRVYEDSFDTFQRQFQLQTDLLTLTEQEQLSVTVFAQFRENHLRQVAALEDEINSIVLDGTREQQQRLTSLVETQQRLIDTSQRQLPVLEELIEARQRALVTQRQQQDAAQRVLELERETKAAVEAAARARERAAATVTEFGRDAGDRLLEQQQAAELAGLTGIRRTLREIEIQENRVAAAARRRVEEQLGESDPAKLAAALQEIDRISQDITARRSAAAQTISDEQRSFSAGWARAFAEYEDAATNSSLAAERIFRKTTQGMEDAIVNFAKTGKFEFRSFAASILEELLRNNIRQLISSTFGATGIGGGGGGGNNRFAGFFATGGTIPSGRFGVVGEAGPELVTGPAQVTPLSGVGSTQVTYNINAVDTQSFQQLLARDPGLLFAITEQGRQNQPIRRR